MYANASESHWVKLRERDFGGDEYFDAKNVTRLELRGYLPIREEEDKSREGGSYYFDRHTRGEIRFESCMHVIANFMRDCFGLDPDVHKVEISCEHWSIPVKSLL